MASYRKLAYVGAIWGLLKYGFGMAAFIGISIFANNTSGMNQVMWMIPELTNAMNVNLLFGIVGIPISIIVIIVTKKVKFTRKKLSVILILAGGVFMSMSWVTNAFMFGLIDDKVACSSTNLNCALDIAGINIGKIHEGMNLQSIIENIPGILLIVSGMLAFRVYRKSRKLDA